MPRGQPDFGIYTQTEMPAGIADPGEAAARLGSINVFDRKGWTIWMDDFEYPALRWDLAYNVAANTPRLSSTFAFMGAQSLYLGCNAGEGQYSRVGRGFGLVRLGRLGVEFWVQANTETPSYLEAKLEILDGTNHTRATLKYDPEAGTISITTPSGDVEVATGIYMTINQHYFVPMKFVVDMDTDLYTRLMVGAEEIDLSSYSMVAVGTTGNKVINVTLQLYGNPDTASLVYIDNFILTGSEP